MKTICYYSIVKFIPDLLRNEPRNIGLIFLNEDNAFYDVKFLSSSHPKLSSSIQSSDKEIITHFSKYYKDNKLSTKKDLVSIANNENSRIQFSEVKAVVTEDLMHEVDFLYNTFVHEKNSAPSGRRRLKTTIQKELRSLKLLGNKKIVPNARVDAPKSHLEYTVDFLYKKNDNIYIIDAVDLTVNDKRDTYKTAFKFKDLTSGRKKNVEAISLVKKSSDSNVKEYLDVLNSTSTVYDYSNGQRGAFLEKMTKLIK